LGTETEPRGDALRPPQPKTRDLVSPRVELFTDSVIREMTRLAAVHGAINMAQGYPDFAAPSALKAAAARAVREDHNQ
jgi:aminotransferase